MKTIDEVREIITDRKRDLKDHFKVKEIGVFGSYVRGQQKEKSDIDLLVEFERPVSLLGLVSLENHLSDLLRIKVDLVPKGDIRPELKEGIIREVIYF
ncbi:MAG: nucleotidyltransferase family protein [Candidatus Methanospirareceae archaeon]